MLAAHSRIRPVSFGGALAALVLIAYLAAPPPHAQAAFSQRVRAGSGASFVDSAGNVWAADRAYSPGGYGYTSGDPYATSSVIAGTPDGPLFQTNRHAAAFAYLFDVPNGAIRCACGSRRSTRPRLAPVGACSTWRSRARQSCRTSTSCPGRRQHCPRHVFSTNVTDGVLTVDFAGLVTHAAVSSIEVTATAAARRPAPRPRRRRRLDAHAHYHPTATPTTVPPRPRRPCRRQRHAEHHVRRSRQPHRTLNGQYPTGLIDWGINAWYLSGPWAPSAPTASASTGPDRPAPASRSSATAARADRRVQRRHWFEHGQRELRWADDPPGDARRAPDDIDRHRLDRRVRSHHPGQLEWLEYEFRFDTADSGTPDFMFSASPASMTTGLTGDVQFSATIEMTGGFSPSSIGCG